MIKLSIYQALQVNAAGSKALITNAGSKKEKLKYTGIYVLKVILNLMFCMVVITTFSMVFGQENSPAGVVLVLFILTFRQADLGIKTSHGAAALGMIFVIIMAGPHLANLAGPLGGFFINCSCILGLLVLGCHNVIMYNHVILVLCYFLLQGNDVSGEALVRRTLGLLAGGVVTVVIFAAKHRKFSYKRTLRSLLEEFDLNSFRTRWYLRAAMGISTGVLLASWMGIPRTMWVAFALNSVLTPFASDSGYKIKRRIGCNIAGSLALVLLYLLVPEPMHFLIAIAGGIGVGFSASYSWQTAFNSFGAITAATAFFGLKDAVILRILTNVLGGVWAAVFSRIFAFFEKMHSHEDDVIPEV